MDILTAKRVCERLNDLTGDSHYATIEIDRHDDENPSFSIGLHSVKPHGFGRLYRDEETANKVARAIMHALDPSWMSRP